MQNNPACPIRGNAGTDLVAGKLRLQVTQHIPSKGKKKKNHGYIIPFLERQWQDREGKT